MIVFCKNCTHFNSEWEIHRGSFKICNHDSNIHVNINYDDYSYEHKQTPKLKNADNNCPYFNPTLKYTVKKFIFKNTKD